MPDNPKISGRALKHLKRIAGRSGNISDEAIYDMGRRLLTLCDVLSEPKAVSKETPELSKDEQSAMEIIQQRARNGEAMPSTRELSRLLKFKSSRSGFLLLVRLLDKGLQRKRGRRLELMSEIEGHLELQGQIPILEPQIFHNGGDNQPLPLRVRISE
jgi:hypothetical protein